MSFHESVLLGSDIIGYHSPLFYPFLSFSTAIWRVVTVVRNQGSLLRHSRLHHKQWQEARCSRGCCGVGDTAGRWGRHKGRHHKQGGHQKQREEGAACHDPQGKCHEHRFAPRFCVVCSPPCTSYSWPDLSMKRRQLLLEVYQLKERNGSKIIKFDQNILQNILYNVCIKQISHRCFLLSKLKMWNVMPS